MDEFKTDPLIKQKTATYLDAAALRSIKEDRLNKIPIETLNLEQQFLLQMANDEEMFDARKKESTALLDLLEYCYNRKDKLQPPKTFEQLREHGFITDEDWRQIFKEPPKGEENNGR